MNKLTLILFFLIALFSCRKKTDEQYPTLQFNAPGVNTYHNVLDPIPFQVKATDETKLVSITVRLLNEQLTPVTSSVTLACSNKEETFDSYILTTDIHLPSGLYYLKAEAFDGTNTKVQYREINLIEVPRTLKKVYVVSQPTSSTIQIDSLYNAQAYPALSITTDYSFTLLSSYYSNFGVAGSQMSNFIALDAEFYNTIYTINNPQTSLNYFVSGYVKNDKTYIADNDGKVKSYKKNGSAIDIIDFGNQLVKTMIIEDDFIFAFAINKTTQQPSIITRYISSGILFQSLNITSAIENIYYLNSNELLLVGNENNQGKILIYDRGLNAVSEPVLFTGGKIFSSCKNENNEILITHDNGLSVFNTLTYSIGSLASGSTYQKIIYEDLSDLIYLAKNNQLEVYSLAPFAMINSAIVNDSIHNIHILYNK